MPAEESVCASRKRQTTRTSVNCNIKIAITLVAVYTSVRVTVDFFWKIKPQTSKQRGGETRFIADFCCKEDERTNNRGLVRASSSRSEHARGSSVDVIRCCLKTMSMVSVVCEHPWRSSQHMKHTYQLLSVLHQDTPDQIEFVALQSEYLCGDCAHFTFRTKNALRECPGCGSHGRCARMYGVPFLPLQIVL